MPRIKLPQLRRPQSHFRDFYAEHIRVERPAAKIASKEENTLFLNGVIDDFFGVSAEMVADSLADMDDSKPLRVMINSPGGFVYEGIAIHNLIADWPQEVTTHVTSIAASMASVIFLVGDKRTIADNAELMVHNPWNIVMGNSRELRAAADHLDKTSEKLLDQYERKSKLSRAELQKLLDGPEGEDGTFLSAAESLEAGFATEIIDTSRSDKEDEEDRNRMPRLALAKVKMMNWG